MTGSTEDFILQCLLGGQEVLSQDHQDLPRPCRLLLRVCSRHNVSPSPPYGMSRKSQQDRISSWPVIRIWAPLFVFFTGGRRMCPSWPKCEPFLYFPSLRTRLYKEDTEDTPSLPSRHHHSQVNTRPGGSVRLLSVLLRSCVYMFQTFCVAIYCGVTVMVAGVSVPCEPSVRDH